MKHLKIKRVVKLKKQAPLLPDDDLKLVERGILACWNYIAPDAAPACGGDNECAIEMCIDADRMTTMCGESGKVAADIIKRVMETRNGGYRKLLSFLSRRIQLI